MNAEKAEDSLNELKEKIASGEFKGEPGAPGRDGVDGRPGRDGSDGRAGRDGVDGKDGKDGTSVEIKDISRSTEDGGKNTVMFSDGNYIDIYNGTKGNKGDPGKDADPYDDTEIRGEISQLSESITTIDSRVTTLENEPKVPQDLVDTVDENKRNIDFLYKISKGQIWDTEQREESGHAQLPSGGEFGNVDEVRGKTEQESTNGYQLLDVLTNRSANFTNFETTINGVTLTMHDDGTISCRGNATATVVAEVAYKTPTKFKAGTYTFSGCPKGGTHAGTYKLDYQSPNFMVDTGNGDTHVYTEDFEIYNVRIVIYVGNGDGLVFKPMLEIGSIAHDYEPYTGGMPLPNQDYPKEIVSVDEIRITHSIADGNVLAERTITPPRPLNAIGEYKDKCDVVNGVWEYASKAITDADFTHSIEREPEYFLLAEPTAEPISETDLEFLRNLTLLDGENLFITDNHGRDVSYLMTDFINLGKVGS